jgi:hypothetical protein
MTWLANNPAIVAGLLALAGLTAAVVARRTGSTLARLVVPAACCGAISLATSLAWSGPLCLVLWILLPLVPALVSLRRARVDSTRALQPAWRAVAQPPDAGLLATEWARMGYEDAGTFDLIPSEPRQSFRFLVPPDGRELVTVAWAMDRGAAFVFCAVCSWDTAGVQWMTWNYPLPYGVRFVPDLRLQRCADAVDPEVLLAQHREFLELNGVTVRPYPDLARNGGAAVVWEHWLQRQLAHNVAVGWLRPVNDGPQVGYSWRGTLGAAWQLALALLGVRAHR